ncbi:glycosyltransferase family 2 protein [Paenibacillus spongiae]|uniref:Glycosyltransferase n=1 Tax=Paenibacillus spongiae TaxID=2909671 RepID=A0ABY5S7N0_9BACL|nr:glycosyltransferase family 2 protein [Paenibacillus spongiae]UVI29684.1 glycosyltransferase [Paenibacillus spongiae]
MGIKVSIIMPSYNRYPLNLLSLYALEYQKFDLSKMEVILVDDASSDDTPLLETYNPPYSFKYVRNKKRRGVSYSRNQGLKKAKGGIIIFLDAEMVVDPKYVEYNYRHHLTNEQAVVFNMGGMKVYSYLFPEFNTEQMNGVRHFAKINPSAGDRLKLYRQQIMDPSNIANYIKRIKEPVPLLDKKNMKSFSQIKPFVVRSPFAAKLHKMGGDIERCHLPWLVCGGNISLKKAVIDAVGGYDEDFTGWGAEDTEFAFRLHKAGIKFVIDPDLTRYHQEHPVLPTKKSEAKKNRVLLRKKHPVFDTYLVSVHKIYGIKYKFMNECVKHYYSLNRKFPGRYKEFNEALVLMLRQSFILQSQNKRIRKLLRKSGLEADPSAKKLIFSQRDEILASGKYRSLVKLFDILSKT